MKTVKIFFSVTKKNCFVKYAKCPTQGTRMVLDWDSFIWMGKYVILSNDWWILSYTSIIVLNAL